MGSQSGLDPNDLFSEKSVTILEFPRAVSTQAEGSSVALSNVFTDETPLNHPADPRHRHALGGDDERLRSVN